MISAGHLIHDIVIQYKAPASPTKNGIGEDDYAWTTFRSTRGRIRAIRGKEQVSADAQESQVETEIQIRYSAGITAGMRVLHGTTYYDVRTVINKDEADRELLLGCTRGNSLG